MHTLFGKAFQTVSEVGGVDICKPSPTMWEEPQKRAKRPRTHIRKKKTITFIWQWMDEMCVEVLGLYLPRKCLFLRKNDALFVWCLHNWLARWQRQWWGSLTKSRHSQDKTKEPTLESYPSTLLQLNNTGIAFQNWEYKKHEKKHNGMLMTSIKTRVLVVWEIYQENDFLWKMFFQELIN